VAKKDWTAAGSDLKEILSELDKAAQNAEEEEFVNFEADGRNPAKIRITRRLNR
jgi:hypothetical protein